MCFLFAVCVIGGEAKQSAFGHSAKGAEDCNCLHLWSESWGRASSSLGLCPGNPVQENFPFRKPVGLSQGGGVARSAFILDHRRVPKLLGTWTRWSKTSSTQFIIIQEADLPFVACIAREVQFGVSPLRELLRQRWLCVCCGSHQEVMKVGGVCGRRWDVLERVSLCCKGNLPPP